MKPSQRGFRFGACAVASSAAALLSWIWSAPLWAAPATRCISQDLLSAGRHARDLAACYATWARTGNESDVAACGARIDAELAMRMGRTAAGVIRDGGSCAAAPADLLLIGDTAWLPALLRADLFATSELLPDECVRRKTEGIGMHAYLRSKCASRDYARPDSGRLRDCTRRAARRLTVAYERAVLHGDCNGPDRNIVATVVASRIAAQMENLRFGDGVLTDPRNGTFHDGPTIDVVGTVPGSEPLANVLVNGVAQTRDASNAFRTTVMLDPAVVFNPIVAEVTSVDGDVRRQRVTVIAGDGIATGHAADGAYASDAVVLRFNNDALSQLQDVLVASGCASCDLQSLIPQLPEAQVDVPFVGLDLPAQITEELGLAFRGGFTGARVENSGMTFLFDAAVTAAAPDPLAPDLTASYTVAEEPPAYESVTPEGGLSYGVAVGFSTSFLNQLLKAQIESGLFRVELSELALTASGPPLQLTVGLLSFFLPELKSKFPATEPLVIEIQPTLAPVLTGRPAPTGELEELRFSHLRIDVRLASSRAVVLGLALDMSVATDAGIAPGGEVVFSISVLPGTVHVDVLRNPAAADEEAARSLFEHMLPLALPQISDALDSFALPAILGVTLRPVEIARQDSTVTVFAMLETVPAPLP